jgi:hypothetical protein
MNGKQNIPLTELFSDEFIHKHTNFHSLQEMVKASGVGDLKNILTPPFAIFASYMSDFQSWETMYETAKAEYYQRNQKS